MGEEMKAINENLLTCRCVRVYTYARSARGCARSCVNWGGGWKSGGGMRKKVGSSEEGGVIVGRKGNQWKYEGGEDGGERETRNEKAFTLCKNGSAEGKVGKISRKIVGSRLQNEAR